ncbi:MAG: hypothetical protein IJX13_01335 [Clostridia bacterium]|nr:hypothetical protein [Clostridia bacterium]
MDCAIMEGQKERRETVEASLFETARKNRLLWKFGICLAVFLIAYDVVYLMDLVFSTDFFWTDHYPVLLRIWTGAVEPLMGYLFYWISFAFVIYGIVRFGIKKSIPFFVLYLCGVLLRFVLNIATYLLYMGAMNWNTFASVELPGVLLSIFGDCLQLGAVILLGYLFTKRKRTQMAPAFDKKARGEWEQWLPPVRFFDWKNPVLRVALLSALIPSALMILQRLYYDVFFWGLPTDGAEWALVLIYYLCDGLSALAGYLSICFLLGSFSLSDQKARLEFEKPFND